MDIACNINCRVDIVELVANFASNFVGTTSLAILEKMLLTNKAIFSSLEASPVSSLLLKHDDEKLACLFPIRPEILRLLDDNPSESILRFSALRVMRQWYCKEIIPRMEEVVKLETCLENVLLPSEIDPERDSIKEKKQKAHFFIGIFTKVVEAAYENSQQDGKYNRALFEFLVVSSFRIVDLLKEEINRMRRFADFEKLFQDSYSLVEEMLKVPLEEFGVVKQFYEKTGIMIGIQKEEVVRESSKEDESELACIDSSLTLREFLSFMDDLPKEEETSEMINLLIIHIANELGRILKAGTYFKHLKYRVPFNGT